MKNHPCNWAIGLGIAFGLALGIIGNRLLDAWPTRVSAVGDEGRKALTEQSASFRAAARAIAPAVVNVTTFARVRYQEFDSVWGPFFRRPRIKEGLHPRGVGSGFVFDAKNGYILTNNHVVAGGDSWIVRLNDKRELEARLVGTDPQTEVAVLQVDARDLPEAVLGNSDSVEVGDWVLAVGNPFGLLENTVTAGIISAKGRHGVGISNYEDFLQTDAAINPGNSGGPLVSLNGEVVGINTAIFSRTGGYQGIGFSIPVNQARRIANQLVKSGKVERGWMGVKVKDLSPADMKQLAVQGGAAVEGVYLRGPAHKAGLLPGDIILQVAGKAVRDSTEIRDMVAEMEPGAKAQVMLLRNDKKQTVNMVVAPQPKDWATISNEEQ
jgi:serine protease Do